jgi:pterin-4a-carbinolamine dehydratase
VSGKDLENLANQTISRESIGADQLAKEVAALGARWTIANNFLQLTLPGPGMTKTCAVTAYAGKLADELDHHPKIVVEYPGLTLTINTHDKNAITVLDFAYAARLEKWLRANGWPT